MRKCSVTKKLRIVAGGLDDYKKLAHYHYRNNRLTAYAAVFAMRLANETVGVIVYTMPSPGLELRSIATGGVFIGFDRATQLALINKNIRCVGRVIIEPRLRGLGLASRLVRETMPLMNVPVIESMAVMGLVNPFFERAGMTAYTAPMPARCAQLSEAFSTVGVEKNMLIDPQKVQWKINQFKQDKTEFIELQIKHFLQSYGKRRNMSVGLERTRFVLSKLTERPVYYIWFNQNTEHRIQDTGYRIMANQIRTIALAQLIAHPDNPNRMSKADFNKLVRNIERTGLYEPMTVRPHPKMDGCFEIINGHHRCKALAQLGCEKADCVVWDVNDEQTGILLATLNRLGGSDKLEKKLLLLKKLNTTNKPAKLGKLLPYSAKQIDRLCNLKLPSEPAAYAARLCRLAEPMVFFLSATQRQIVENALALAEPAGVKTTKAVKNTNALVNIAQHFIRKCEVPKVS